MENNGPFSSEQALCHRSTGREGVSHHPPRPCGRVPRNPPSAWQPMVDNEGTIAGWVVARVSEEWGAVNAMWAIRAPAGGLWGW